MGSLYHGAAFAPVACHPGLVPDALYRTTTSLTARISLSLASSSQIPSHYGTRIGELPRMHTISSQDTVILQFCFTTHPSPVPVNALFRPVPFTTSPVTPHVSYVHVRTCSSRRPRRDERTNARTRFLVFHCAHPSPHYEYACAVSIRSETAASARA